jgi:hypothetical protein
VKSYRAASVALAIIVAGCSPTARTAPDEATSTGPIGSVRVLSPASLVGVTVDVVGSADVRVVDIHHVDRPGCPTGSALYAGITIADHERISVTVLARSCFVTNLVSYYCRPRPQPAKRSYLVRLAACAEEDKDGRLLVTGDYLPFEEPQSSVAAMHGTDRRVVAIQDSGDRDLLEDLVADTRWWTALPRSTAERGRAVIRACRESADCTYSAGRTRAPG